MADVAVVSASLGGIDLEAYGAVEQTIDADWWYVTDQRIDLPKPWKSVHDVSVDGDPRMHAKRYRMTPWDVFLDVVAHTPPRESDYRYVVWLDSSMEVISPTFLEEAIASVVRQPKSGVAERHRPPAPLAAWKHPRRDCVYEEAEWSLKEAPEKYEAIAHGLGAQCDVYRAEGFPHHAGLYATGTLVWNMGHPRARELGAAWLEECRRTTVQDQVSLPYVAWKLGLPIATFPCEQVPKRPRYVRDPFTSEPLPPSTAPVDYIENRWTRIHPHSRRD